MLLAAYLLNEILKKIKKIRNTLTPKIDIEHAKRKLKLDLTNIQMHLEELRYTTGTNYDRQLSFINKKADKLNEVETLEDMEELLDEIIMILDVLDLNLHVDSLSYLEHRYLRGADEYKYTTEELENISRLLNTPYKRTINIFNPNCKYGNNLSMLDIITKEDVKTYGLESDSYYYESAAPKLYKLAKGKFAGSRISNDAFDLMLIDPDFDVRAEFNNFNVLKPRKELEYIRNCMKYLRKDGIMVLRMPNFRLESRIIALLTRNFRNFSVFNSKISSLNINLVTIIAQKGTEEEYNEKDVELLKSAFYAYPSLSKLSEKEIKLNYMLPDKTISIDTFRGSILDAQDLNQAIKGSGLYDSFMKSQSEIIESAEDKKPLLPFNIGQIGLVLTSGCLDGVIEEFEEGHAHVIKGMIIKEKHETEVRENRKIKQEIITTNKVQIDIITPSGEYKELT